MCDVECKESEVNNEHEVNLHHAVCSYTKTRDVGQHHQPNGRTVQTMVKQLTQWRTETNENIEKSRQVKVKVIFKIPLEGRMES